MKRFSKKTNFAILSVIAVLIILLIGMLKIEKYQYYELPFFNKSELHDENHYRLINHQVLHDGSNSREILIDYYQSINGFDEKTDLYAVLITVNINLDNDLSKSTVRQYDRIKNVTLKTDVKTNESGYQIMSYVEPNWGSKKKGKKISFNINNLIGQKDLGDSLNGVGYSHTGTNIWGKYQANFEYFDYVDNSSISTIYYVTVPKDDDIVKFPLSYKVEIEHVELFPFSIKKTTTSGEWITITYNYPKKTD